jgi:hypothetical protein
MLPGSHLFRYGSTLLFQRSGVTICLVRKCTAFIEYVHCMFEDLEIWIHVHQWLATNDFNYSDGYMHRLWWISPYFFIGIKVVVYLPSRDIVGNDVTSRIFLSWMIIFRSESVHTFGQPTISAIVLISHAPRTGVCVCVCVCVCAC